MHKQLEAIQKIGCTQLFQKFWISKIISSSSVRNLGVLFDRNLSFESHVSSIIPS